MSAYYNEHDPYAAQWLRNLIAEGHVAPGEVDERDIKDVKPDELRGYTQCHFFAGIGIWSYALRRAGWPDDRAVWTGSCPCQPFSAAGGRRGAADERHLWPHWFHLIEERRPPVVLGEQVASKDGLGWLDLVSDDMEGARYAFGASDLCAAGFSGAHIRQRLYFVGMAHHHPRLEGRGEPGRQRPLERVAGTTGLAGGVALANGGERKRLPDGEGRQCNGQAAGRLESDGIASASGDLRGLADATFSAGQPGFARSEQRAVPEGNGGSQPFDGSAPAPMLGRHAADWLFCRDGRWRPVEPGTFPLVDKTPARVGRLRAYGNGLDAETATGFIEAVMECLP